MGNDSEKCRKKKENNYFTINHLFPKFLPFKGNVAGAGVGVGGGECSTAG